MGIPCYNTWTNDPFIYKSTVSGIKVYDLETTSLLNFVEHDYVSSVWANEYYLYVATSVSGIYRCEISTVTGTVTLEPYKQYPEITSNYVYCIHGGVDYLCATTESGVDHYNLTTGSGIYTTLSGVSKCFQTERGEFYYSYNPPDAAKELHVVYDNTNNWNIETVGHIYTIDVYNADYFDGAEAWLGTFNKRIKLTIDNTNIDSALTDFPVLIKLSNSSGITSADVTSVFTELGSDANRKKIAVTTFDGNTQCYVEIERFDYSSNEAWVWVKIPSIFSGATTDLYLYYDSIQLDNTTFIGDTGDTPAQNVWDSNFKLVMHMAQDPNGDVADAIKDSTSNANHGTPGGSMTTADLVDGKIGKSIEFDGSNDYIDIGTDGSLNITGAVGFTIESIVNSVTNVAINVVAKDVSGDRGFVFRLQNLYPQLETNGTEGLNATNAVGSGVTTYIAVTQLDTAVKHFKNADTNGTGTRTAVPSTAGAGQIGRRNYSSYYEYFSGKIDEVRISNIPRSTYWIKTTYYSNWDGLVSFGSEEDIVDPQDFIRINDLHITEKTSKFNEGNVIFLATTNGVTVIEEKPGDEENSNFKYYYIST